ncbi:MAG: hypothetical protein D6732_24400 [Methanobacteriota archaeon]|nr:MAG: hypothetical protein D6732_24400 [Euryarchaeota archaeon]
MVQLTKKCAMTAMAGIMLFTTTKSFAGVPVHDQINMNTLLLGITGSPMPGGPQQSLMAAVKANGGKIDASTSAINQQTKALTKASFESKRAMQASRDVMVDPKSTAGKVATKPGCNVYSASNATSYIENGKSEAFNGVRNNVHSWIMKSTHPVAVEKDVASFHDIYCSKDEESLGWCSKKTRVTLTNGKHIKIEATSSDAARENLDGADENLGLLISETSLHPDEVRANTQAFNYLIAPEPIAMPDANDIQNADPQLKIKAINEIIKGKVLLSPAVAAFSDLQSRKVALPVKSGTPLEAFIHNVQADPELKQYVDMNGGTVSSISEDEIDLLLDKMDYGSVLSDAAARLDRNSTSSDWRMVYGIARLNHQLLDVRKLLKEIVFLEASNYAYNVREQANNYFRTSAHLIRVKNK